MIAVIKKVLKRYRLKRYLMLLERDPLMGRDINTAIKRLATLWRLIKPSDISVIDPHVSGLLQIHTWTSNVVELVEVFALINKAIHEGDDETISNLNLKYHERRYIELDYFLADENRHSVAMTPLLIRLSGHLQEHCYLIDQQTNQYYQRQTARYYQDIIELTETLIHYSIDPTGATIKTNAE